MSRVFGPIRQAGYVVRDIEAAMKHWTEVLGVGPFLYIPHSEAEEFWYRGERTEPDVSVALAFSGDLQIELIAQHNDAPSMYRDFLAAGREGLQHLSAWVADYEAAIARATAEGHRIAQHGALPGGVKFAYFDTELHPGTVFEISNVDIEPFRSQQQRLAEIARTWDGSDPIRRP